MDNKEIVQLIKSGEIPSINLNNITLMNTIIVNGVDVLMRCVEYQPLDEDQFLKQATKEVNSLYK